MSSFGDINRVNTNIQALDSQLSLNRINRNLADNQLRLSTGLKINRAEDDAAGYSIATKLNARVAGLNQALANTGDAKSVLDITESSFNTVMDQLIEMKGLATRAANETLGDTERGFIGDQIKALGTDVNEIANQTVFQDFELLNGEDAEFSGDLKLTFQVGERAADTVSVDISAVNVNSLFTASAATVTAQTATLTVATGAAAANVTQVGITIGTNDELTFNVTGATTAAAGSDEGIAFRQNIATAINNSGSGVTASVDETSGAITVNNFNSETGNTAAIRLLDNADAAVAVGNASAAIGTLKAEGQQGALDVDSWDAGDFRNFIQDVDSAITAMAERVNTVGIAQSSLSLREVTLSQSISANSAASSRIMDTDFAKEQSESIRLQILQQTATSAFAQANSGPQSVLGFLR